jgi:rRNA maturation protein Rpf1
MPYITFSRNSKVPRRKMLDACTRLGGIFEHSFVAMRGGKSIKDLAYDAASRGFCAVLILNDEARKIEVLKPQNLGSSYAWGNEYILKLSKARLAVERGGRDAKKAIIKEAGD